MDLLDEWSSSLTEQQKNQLLKDNFSKLNQYVQFTGFELITTVSASVQTALTTNYVIQPYNAAIQTSGGLVAIIGTVFVYGFNGLVNYQYVIDGIAKDVHLLDTLTGSTTVHQEFPLNWIGTLPAGEHTIQIQAKTGGGTCFFGSNTSPSTYYVLEFRKG